MLVDILDEQVAFQHKVLEGFEFCCLVVKGHYGSITARSADQLYACSCDACDAEASMRLLLRERKKFL